MIDFGAETVPSRRVLATTGGGVSCPFFSSCPGLARALVLRAVALEGHQDRPCHARHGPDQKRPTPWAQRNRVFIFPRAGLALGGAAGVMVGISYNTVYPAMGVTAGLNVLRRVHLGG